MAITCGFFNSKNGDRKYNAEQMSKYFDKLVTSGVFPNPSTQLQVVESSGMTVNVLPGRGLVDCHWIENDSNYALTLDGSDAVLNRIDAVVMKLDLNEAVRDVHIEIKKGTPASTPVAPSMERSTYVQEYCLATIYVGKLAESITQANITDTRQNSAVCGWVTGLIEQVDTSALFTQWQSAYEQYYNSSTADFEEFFEESKDLFDEWFQHLKETVSTAATIKSYTRLYTTTAADEETISIGIPSYNAELDILNVYVNGFKLIPTVDYAVDDELGTNVTLTKPLDAGTPILFEVYKTADA